MQSTILGNRKLALLGLLVVVLTAFFAAPAQAADDPNQAPATTLSADGRTVSGAASTFAISQAHDLAGNGQMISLSGAGFDTNKGIYIGLCVLPPTNQPPSPCGGGQDRTGTEGVSVWISNNPPDYAQGLTRPYGPGGSFSATIHVAPQINGTFDCYSVRCALVTRNDHIRSSDRSQDLFIPVTFAPPVVAPPTTPHAPTTTTTMAPATTVPTTDPKAHAPKATVAANGKSVTDGKRTLFVSTAKDLDPTKQQVRVRGEGFNPNNGIFVALCRKPELDKAPEPCTAPPKAAAWISNNPPDYGKQTAQPFGSKGTFSVTLTVNAVIDAKTDCRKVSCVIAVRSDAAAIPDRSVDLFLPVSFAAKSPPKPVIAAEPDDAGTPWLPITLGIVGVALAAGAAILFSRKRARQATGDDIA